MGNEADGLPGTVITGPDWAILLEIDGQDLNGR